jgi:aspartyl-tRNA(Asn)/glutamyl-tRNA(Gln) amidotransferase subunit A
MTEALHFLTIAEAARRLEAKTLSPVALVDALLERIEQLNPQLDAFVTPMGQQARETAQQAEAEIMAGRYLGPLHGIPFGLKDIYDKAGTPTTGHSRTAMDNVPATDSTVTARLTAAGGILMGKLSTHEFAHGGPSFDLPWPPARNPWNREHFTGGSSSGSGAVVAAGFLFGSSVRNGRSCRNWE